MFPHHMPAFTQGLYHDGNVLYESTGLYSQSSIKVIATDDGRVIKSIPLEREFSEGITCIDNKLVQLTWESGIALVYKIPEMEKIGQFDYNGQGWGLTSKGSTYIMTNGSHFLYYRDDGFKIIKTKAVTLNRLPLKNLNDLTYSSGHFYANVLYEDYIFEICEKTGNVKTLIDCSELKRMSCINTDMCILNGIAYDEASDTFYLTGKNWAYIFQVKFGSDS